MLIPFIAYFCILLFIGIISHRRQNTDADFIVGNRSLNFWVTALSAHASDMSSWLFMAFPAAIFLGGLSQAWLAVGLILGMLLNWQVVATRLRVQTENLGCYTLSTFFEKRFNETSGILRLSTAFTILFFLTCYVGAGLIAMGGILESVFGIDFYIGLTLSSLVILIYTFFGGFITVAWTDVFQALFLITMIILVPFVAYSHLDMGWQSIIQAADAKQISLDFIPDLSISSIAGIVMLALSWGLGYFGQPHIVTKFMGIKEAADMGKSKVVGMTWQLIALSSAAFVGLVGIAFFKEGLHNPEKIFVEMVKILFHPLAAGFILCGVLAASMSTMDSMILVCGSVVSEDLYKHMFKKQASGKELLIVTRFGVCLISALSLFFALNRNTTIQEAVHYAWSGTGSAFGPLVLMSLYSKKANKYGAIAGVFVGGILAATWGLINPYITSYIVPAMIPAFFLSWFSIWFVSKITQKLINTDAQTKIA